MCTVRSACQICVPVALRQPDSDDRPHKMARWKLWPRNWSLPPTAGDASPHCGSDAPQCGGSVQSVPVEPPQCGELPPQCGDGSVQRAEEALDAITRAWAAHATEAPQCGQGPWFRDPKDLAQEFRHCLQKRPELIGMGIHREWIQTSYPLFCQAEQVVFPPPYKDFAKQLATLMPRKRGEAWSGGKRMGTCTRYRVPDPDVAVVELAEEKRKRA